MKPDMLKTALAKQYQAGHATGFKEGYAEGMVAVVQNYSAAMLICLHDHFDFTTEQLQEIAFHTNNYFDSLLRGLVTLSDVTTALKEEENIDIKFDGIIGGIDLAIKEDVSTSVKEELDVVTKEDEQCSII